MLNRLSVLFITGLLFFSGAVEAQSTAEIKAVEDSLLVTADSMYNAFIPDERPGYTQQFVKQLIRALKYPGSYDYPFERLATKINIIYPDDKKFRIFNWSISPNDVTLRYYGAIQMPGEKLKLYPLIDYTSQLGKGAEDSVLTGGKWYGVLYYKIIPHEVDGQTIYTMFGKDASNAISDKKVLDAMVLTENGPVFGAPIFGIRSQNYPSERVKRFIIEYKKGVQASMNWDADMNAIFFDRLASDVNDPNRKYTFIPTGQYDGFRWNDGNWTFVQDLIPVDALKDGQAPTPVPVKGKE